MRQKKAEEHTSKRILIVDDDQVVRTCAAQILAHHGFFVRTAPDAETALKILGVERFDLLLADLRLPDLDGIQLIREAHRRRLGLRSLVISGHGTIERAVEAMKAGAEQFITKPFLPDELMAVVSSILSDPPPHGLAAVNGFGEMVGSSAPMRELYRMVEKIAASDSTVLLLGESGTGKELVARTLHERSPRRARPFVSVNCAIMPEDLLQPELFGHAHDGVHGKPGLFEVAEKGTLFLDGIGETGLGVQAEILRALEDRRVRPRGATREVPVDVRVIAATDRDLSRLVEAGSFRLDLFSRLNGVSLTLPPLRERREDIPSLVTHFLSQFAVTHLRRIDRIHPHAMERLLAYDYPGNVRELRSAIERAVLLSEGQEILPGHLPPSIQDAGGAEGSPLYPTLDERERHYIEKVLQVTRGHRGEAARILGIDRRTLYDKIKRYGLFVTHASTKPERGPGYANHAADPSGAFEELGSH